MLEHYQKAINEIDDYFEYSFESKKDKDRVVKILDKLNKKLLCMSKRDKTLTTII